MKRSRSVIEVTILIDLLPGWGHQPEDHVKHIERFLSETIPHYKPTVKLLRTEDVPEKGGK